MVVEKAFAKLHGSYGALDGASPPEITRDHSRSLEVARDRPSSPKLTQAHTSSHKLTQAHTRSPNKVAQQGRPRSPKLTQGHTSSPKVAKPHPRRLFAGGDTACALTMLSGGVADTEHLSDRRGRPSLSAKALADRLRDRLAAGFVGAGTPPGGGGRGGLTPGRAREQSFSSGSSVQHCVLSPIGRR